MATRDGGAWAFEMVDPSIGAGAFNGAGRALAFDPAGNLAIAYTGISGEQGIDTLKFAVRIGGAWNVEIVETGVEGYGIDPSLAYDPVTGSPSVVHSDVYTFGGPRFLRWDGSAWELVVDFGESAHKGSTLAYDANGDPYVAYGRTVGHGSNTTWEVIVAHWDGVAWQKELVDFASGARLSFRFDPTGRPCLAYENSGDLTFARRAAP